MREPCEQVVEEGPLSAAIDWGSLGVGSPRRFALAYYTLETNPVLVIAVFSR